MYQVIAQTHDEKMVMYMKLSKKQLVEMLINCNDIITTLIQAKDRVMPTVMSELTCDSCGCHPNTMYKTSKGRFCEKCKPTN